MSKVAIITNFKEYNPGYSLTGIVRDQSRMLSHNGHEVVIFVSESFTGEEVSEYADLKKVIPASDLIDYQSLEDISEEHLALADDTALALAEELQGYDFAFVHDFLFTGWNLPYARGIRQIARELKGLRWLHWVHSIPGGKPKDWWNIKSFGPGHKLVFPVAYYRTFVAERWLGAPSDVLTIPHIKDLRTWFEFSDETCEFIDLFPQVMQADIVQVYPASTDRLEAKGVDKLLLLFAMLKKLNFSVCLVVANQWATKIERKEDVNKYRKKARRNGLDWDRDIIFTSEWKPEYEAGISQRILRELMQCANLFVYPTREESFGLVGPEAALAGGNMLVLNKSLPMMMEVYGFTGILADFGSFEKQFDKFYTKEYIESLANIILGRMRENEAINTKTYVRKQYNWDNIYSRYYAPVMESSKLWGGV